MELIHPIKNEKKSQYIEYSDKSKSLLIDNKNYVFLRRFSAKGDKSRLIATPYYSEFTEHCKIGVENHLNYFYRLNGELNKVEVVGLAALLNSTLFDTYFRTINGNTNVSATELREIKFPPYKTIIEIGENLISKKNITQEMIDLTINEVLKFDFIAN
jgi:adenine-specific DNA-methyltransferase